MTLSQYRKAYLEHLPLSNNLDKMRKANELMEAGLADFIQDIVEDYLMIDEKKDLAAGMSHLCAITRTLQVGFKKHQEEKEKKEQ